MSTEGVLNVAIKEILKTHRTWEDGAGLMLGLMIGFSPWLCEESTEKAVVSNAALVGIALLILAQLELIRARRWEEIAELACGIWLCASPFMFGYAHVNQLRYWHWVLGSMVVLLAVVELWQSRPTPVVMETDRTNEQL
jgi:hypothetical protein